MLTRSIVILSTLVLGLSLLGCDSSSLPAAAKPEKPSISKVKEDLRTRLDKDDRLQGSKITFDYDGMTVILNGVVKDREQFGWASTVAAGTTGVTSVINRLQVEQSAPEAEKPKAPMPKKQIPKTPAPEPQALPTQTSPN
ncbi:MAG: BON domain-containing protein [Acidobacteriia bacterium]|nr:BON domain-containing protein [Terriglobia bacterium]